MKRFYRLTDLFHSIGHSAQYCTYTTIKHNSRDIVHIVTMDKRETCRKSVAMEKACFIQMMETLRKEIPMKEVVTDAHVRITTLFSKDSFHLFDFFMNVLFNSSVFKGIWFDCKGNTVCYRSRERQIQEHPSFLGHLAYHQEFGETPTKAYDCLQNNIYTQTRLIVVCLFYVFFQKVSRVNPLLSYKVFLLYKTLLERHIFIV